MAQLCIDAPAIRHIIVSPLLKESQPTDFVIKMKLLTTLSMEFSLPGLPLDQWDLPSLRTFGLSCYDLAPAEIQSLLCNVGKTITTLSYEANHSKAALTVPEDIWVWCPLMSNLRIRAGIFDFLRPPPTGRKPITIYIIDMDNAIGAADLDSRRLLEQVAEWGPVLDKVSFGTPWSNFFSQMTRVDSYYFRRFIKAVGEGGYRLYDREGVSSEEIDMGGRFDRAEEIYRRNRYY
jgi:hypothetical protein